jgi:DNA-directed RNA polymerase specialized sigma24 family protein
MTSSVPEETLSMGNRRAGTGRDAAVPTRSELAEVLFRRHYAELLRLAVVMLGNREAAEDAVQEAFVALHRHGR